MTSSSKLILAIALLCIVHVSSHIGFPMTNNAGYQTQEQSIAQSGVQVLYYDQKVSHYNYKQSNNTFKQKYLMDDSNWVKSKGPIIVYMGNEGPIEMFYRNAGFYNEVVGKQLGGMLLYPEHRYFGVSMPFGDKDRSYLKENLVYLTTQQALMDFVQFIKFIKAKYCEDCKVIAFGGSYGGMLAAWIRMKYPHVVDMSHAASAPIYYYKNRKGLDLGIFFEIVTKNYKMHSQNCANVIRQGFRRLNQMSQSPTTPTLLLSQYFNLCHPLKSYKDIPLLMQYINDGYSYMAMLNYPYPTSFLKNLTSWPANSSCTPLSSVNTSSLDKQLFTSISQSIAYYYSFGQKKCNEIYEDQTADEDLSGWNILACGDEAMPMNMDGKKDMFYEEKFDFDAYTQECKTTYGITPDYEYTLNHFGGVTDKEYLSYSNIFFTNGGLDPWSGASPTKTLSQTLIACYMEFGAHHLDLRAPNAADPDEVVKCRELILSTFKKWLGKSSQKIKGKMIRTQ